MVCLHGVNNCIILIGAAGVVVGHPFDTVKVMVMPGALLNNL